MKRTDTVIIGGGQAGLAMSRCLSDRAVDHVVLERGRLAERWRSERWDSLRLLTPNWQSRLPGFRYEGADPDGFMTMPEVIAHFERYARSFTAPVEAGTSVLGVVRDREGYRVTTDRGDWTAANVVIATGHCNVPCVPELGADLSPGIRQLVPGRYRNPGELEEGGVLVVGASASGVQLAEEIQRSGRPVTLSVGRHIRIPRRYRGRDIMRWLDAAGILDETADDAYDIAAARRQPSLQLVGRETAIDLGTLQSAGVRLAGKLVAAEGDRISLDDSLERLTTAADAKLSRLLRRIDAYIAREALAGEVEAAEPIAPIRVAEGPSSLDLHREGIRTVVWATGFRRSYPWLKVPVLDERGEIRHRGGVTEAPGLYVLGLAFLRRRKSSFIDGVGDDARELAEHLVSRLAHRHAVA